MLTQIPIPKVEGLYQYLKQIGFNENQTKDCVNYVKEKIRVSFSFDLLLSYIESKWVGKKLSSVQIEKINGLLLEIQRNTRMFIYRGFTPNEYEKPKQSPKK